MPIRPALKAVVVFALGADEFFAITLNLEDKCVVAIGCGTPGDVFLDVQRGFQRQFFEFCQLLLR
jgi:hypothetical protein